MKLEEAQFIVDACEENGLDASLREAYSGRCMYGSTTAGVVVQGGVASIIPCLMQQARELAATDSADEIPDFYDEIRTDSMGLGTIIY